MYATVDTDSLREWIAGPAKFSRFLATALILVVSPLSADEPAELWYRIELAGQTAGWVQEREQTRDGELWLESTMHLELRRGQTATTIEMASRFVEDADGRPLRAWTRQKLGALPVESTFEFQDGGVTVEHRQGTEAAARTEQLPWPEGEWLTPGQAQARSRDHLAGATGELVLRTLDPLLGVEPVTTTWVLEASHQEVLTDQGLFAARRWRQTQSFAPQVETRLYVDGDGRAVRSETSLMGIDMVLVLSDEATARKAPRQAPELLVRTFVRPDRKIEAPRSTRRAVYELELPDQAMPELPGIGAQSVERHGATLRVSVDLARQPALEPADEKRFLASTTYLPHDDPALRDLLGSVDGLDDAPTPLRRAEILRSFVADYLETKDLNTVLGTAAEVAATRSGDCTEHSVLLAALLRGAGIGSRLVSGLIYVRSFAGERDIFGYHMWTQALIGGRWVDLDATLSGARFDAAHIALATASASGAETSVLQEMAQTLPLMDRLEIRVLETE